MDFENGFEEASTDGSRVLSASGATLHVSGGVGGQGGRGGQNGGAGGNGEGPVFNFSRAERLIVHVNDSALGNSRTLASAIDSGPRAISLCELNLQQEVFRRAVYLDRSQVNSRRHERIVVKRYCTAELENRKQMTVLYLPVWKQPARDRDKTVASFSGNRPAATASIMTVTTSKRGNTTDPTVTVTVASIQGGTVVFHEGENAEEELQRHVVKHMKFRGYDVGKVMFSSRRAQAPRSGPPRRAESAAPRSGSGVENPGRPGRRPKHNTSHKKGKEIIFNTSYSSKHSELFGAPQLSVGMAIFALTGRKQRKKGGNIIFLYGIVQCKNIHASIFYDALIPLNDIWQRSSQQSPMLPCYIYASTRSEFKVASHYFERCFGSTLYNYHEICAEGPFSNSVSMEFALTTTVRFRAVYNTAGQHNLDSPLAIAPTLDTVCHTNGCLIPHWDAFLNNDRVPVHTTGNGWDRWGSAAEHLQTSFPVSEILNQEETGLSILVFERSSDFSGTWLSQANFIFNGLGVFSKAYNNYALLTAVFFDINLKLNPQSARSTDWYSSNAFLFLCPPESYRVGPASFKCPECVGYWSFDPSGVDRLSEAKACELGFPAIYVSMRSWGQGWSDTIYTGLRQFHQGKGFDPDSQDLARHLGYPLYQLYSDHEKSLNVDPGGEAHIEEASSTDPDHRVDEDKQDNLDMVQDEESESVSKSGALDEDSEDMVASSSMKMLALIQLSLILASAVLGLNGLL
ncbi:hypothetical protein R3P38DRAFT_3354663 [Favolaschia claudopus]|uniref:Uncharacterized protein n=1 Tax=Favolaschia claudopus TaxID=2862362 RepID=A0AAW0BNP3_9AGAR